MLIRKRSQSVSPVQVGAVLTLAVLGVSAFMPRARAADVTLTDTLGNLTTGSSWTGGLNPQPADVAVFGNLLTGAVNTTFTWAVGGGTENSWAGIKVLNPGGNIIINDSANLLTLGSAGIDMSAVTVNLSLDTGLTLGSNQTWNVDAGTTLLVGGPVSLSMNSGSTTSNTGLVVQGAGNTVISGVISGGTTNTFSKLGTGTLTLSSQNTYTGATIVGGNAAGGGAIVVDFSALGASAPASNIFSAGSQLRIGNASLVINGNPSFAVSQTFGGLQLMAGFTTISTPNVGAGLAVNFGAITASSQNNGAMVRFDANTSNSTLIATSVPTRVGGPLGTFIANNVGGMIATFGLYDWAAVNGSGVIVPAGSTGTTAYTEVGPGANAGVAGLIDITGGGNTILNANADYTAVRFNTNSSSQDITGINNGRFGGFLMTPNVGAMNVTVAGNNMRTLNQNNSNAQWNFWQNDAAGTLTVSASLGGNGTGLAASKAGPGLVIFTGGVKGIKGGLFIYEGELRVDAADQLGNTTGSPINLWGGVLGVSNSITNSNAGNQHPISVGAMGGGINVLSGSTFTISGSSNTAISGSGVLTKLGDGTLSLQNTAGTWTGGLAINGGIVDVTATVGTPLGTGPVNVNAGGTLTATGVIPASNAIIVNSGGTYFANSGTVSGVVTLKPGSTFAGTGNTSTAVEVVAGATLAPSSTGALGNIGFQSLTLDSGSILNFGLRVVPKGSDIINILPGGTLNLAGSGIVLNMNSITTGFPYFFNGSYQLFSGLDVLAAGAYSGGATQGVLTNFVAGNFATSGGATATFSILGPATDSSVWVTILGAITVTNWTGAGTTSGLNWADPGNWDGGTPGAHAGDVANIAGVVAPTTLALNGNQHLGTLGVDNGTNSGGWTITPGAGGKLFLDNGTLPAVVQVGTGANVITADVDVLSPSTFSMNDPAGSLTITGVVNTPSASSDLTIAGAGALVLAANNTLTANGNISANGTLQLGNDTATGTWGSGTLTDAGNLIVRRTGSFNLSALAGRVVGNGILTQAGASSQMLYDNSFTSGAFTGKLNVAGGTVTVGPGAVFAPTGLTIGSGGTFDLGGNSLTFSTLTTAGVITNTSATPVTLSINNANLATLGGSLTNGAGSLSILKTGVGTLTLNGTNSYTGQFIVNNGVVNVNNSTALPAGTQMISNLTDGVNFADGTVIASDFVIGRDVSQAFYTWEIPTGNVTFAGNMWTGTNSQFRVRVIGAGTATVTGVWNQTNGNLTIIAQGNFVFDGTGSKFIAGPNTQGADQVIGIGRSEAAGASRNTNITLRNGAQWINTSVSGVGVALGAPPANQTNAVQTLTVDHSSVLIGTLAVELAGQTTASNLNLIGGTIVAGSYLKTFNNSVTTFNIDGGLIQATAANPVYIPAASNLVMALGTGGAFIDTQGFSLGMGSPFSTATGVTVDGGITFLGAGPVTFNGSGATYGGPTNISTNTLFAGADNVLSPNSPLIFHSIGTVNAGGFSESVGGMDDQNATKFAVNFSSVTFSPQSPNVLTFGGTVTATNLAIAGSGTQILTNAATSWTGSTTLGGGAGLGGGKLIVGSSSTPGLTVSNSGSFGVGVGENTLVWWKGTAASAGLTASSLAARQVGGVGNIIIADGTNGVDNFIKLTTFTPGFVDQGTFFNGADYAYIDATGGFFRAPVYGGADAGFAAADSLTSGSHVLVTGADALGGSGAFNTIKITGTGALAQAGNALTLTNGGILKAGGGTGSISGGTIVTGSSGGSAPGDFIVRVDGAADVLNLNSTILDNGVTPFYKSGSGVLRLGGANTFSGKTAIYGGTLVLTNSQALQDSILVYPALSAPLAFSNISAATIAGLQNSSGNAKDILLQNDSGSAVALTINFGDTVNTETLFNHFTGSGSLIKDGQGSIVLSASNSFSGGVVLLNGTLSANATQALNLPTGSFETSLGTGPLTLTGGLFRGRASGSFSYNLPNDIIANGNAQINLSGTSDVTFSGRLSGSGTLTRSGGSGILNLTATDNSAFHGTFINSDALNNVNSIAFASLGALPATDSTWILNATYSMTISATASSTIGFILNSTESGSSVVINNVNTSGSIATTLNLGPYASDTTFAGNIASTSGNSITLVKLGSGKLSLSGTGSNYAGVTIAQGTLSVSSLDNGVAGATNPLGISSSILMEPGTTLQYTGTGNSTAKTLAFAGSATLDASGTGAVNFSNSAPVSYSNPGSLTITLTGNSTATNVLAAQIVDNGTSSVSLAAGGTGFWTLSNTGNTFSGGTTIGGGEIMITNATGNALGTGAVNISGGGTLAGSGYTVAPVNVNSGGHLGGGGTSLANHLGTINLGGLVTLNAGSILDFDMSVPGSPNDLISFFGSGGLVLSGGAGSVNVNLFNSNITSAYFYNGTYNMFINVPNTASVAATLSALKVANEDLSSGASFNFSLADTGSLSRIVLTIAGAWNDSTWTNAASDSQWTNAGTADWLGGVPNGSGHLANFLTNITAAQNITMVGGKTLTNLTFNNTNSFNITGTDTLVFAAGSANGALLTVTAGKHTVNTPISITAAVLTVSDANNTTLTIKDLSGSGSLALTGGGSLVITGNAAHSGGTSIAAASKLFVGNGSTGTLSGSIDNLGTLAFNHTDNISFAVSNLVQSETGGTLTQAGTGLLTLQGGGSLVPGPLAVTAGKLTFDTDLMVNGTDNGNVTVGALGTLDLGGHTEHVAAFVNAGTVTSASGPGTLFLSGANALSTNSGMITGSLVLVKDGAGTVTFANGSTVNNTSLIITGGQIVFTATASNQLSSQIIMAHTDAAVAGLVLGAASLSTNILLSSFNGNANANVEFLSTLNSVNGTFAGNVTVDPSATSIQQMRLGNTSTSGTLTFVGNMTVPASNVVGTISRGNVVLAGNGIINSLAPDSGYSASNIFTIGEAYNDTTSASVNFSTIGNSQLLTAAPDTPAVALGSVSDIFSESVGLRLGNPGATVTTTTFVHTIAGSAWVRVGANGASAYDIQPSFSAVSNTLNLNGGSLELARFAMSGTSTTGNGGTIYPQANVIFNGGTVVAGLANNDLTTGPGSPFNMKFTIGAGGMTLDLNGKSGVAWTKPLTSGAPAGTAFTDGGLTYVSRIAPASITLSTRQLYAGRTTIGTGATVIAGGSDVLGNPAAAAPVNFDGGILRMTQSFTLASSDGGSANLTHRFSFNDSGTNLVDSGSSPVFATLNSNATQNGGVVSMTGLANSGAASLLGVTDIGGTSTAYTANGVTFAVWYTPAAQAANAVLFSLGQNSTNGPQTVAGSTASSYFMLQVASGSATGNIRAMLDAGGGEISATSAQPASSSEHLAVVTIDAGDLSLFVDGVLTQRTPLSTLGGGTVLQNLTAFGGIMLGGSQYSADPSFNGSINEFRVYNTVLNSAYISAMKAQGPNTLAPAVPLYRDINVTSTGTLDLAGFQLNVGGNMTGPGTLTLTPGTLVLTGNSSTNINLASGAKLLVTTGGSPGALNGGHVSGTGTFTVDTNTTLTSDGVTMLNGSWVINGTQVLRSSASGGAYSTYAALNSAAALSGTSEVSTLTFGAAGHLDLKNNALIVEATAATKATLLQQIAGEVSLGTITSSTAATNPFYGVIVADNKDLGAATFGGLPVDANSIIVTQALLGDANLDGVVNPTDLLIYAHNFNNTGSFSVASGDFNNDGVVNPTDLLIYAHNFNNNIGGGTPSLATGGGLTDGLGGSGPGSAVATPEPTSLCLLGLGAVGLLVRRKRRHAGDR